MTFTVEKTVCLKCGKPLERLIGHYSTDWAHRMSDGWPRVGCRAATYTQAHGWDDTVPVNWRATPDVSKIETMAETLEVNYGDDK